MHPRTWIRCKVVDLLCEAGFTGRAFPNQEEPWARGDFPSIGVYTSEETAIESDLSPKSDDRSMTLAIDILEDCARTDAALDDRMDALAGVVERAISFTALKAKVQDGTGQTDMHIPLLDLRYSGATLGMADDGQQTIACITLTYIVEYRVPPAQSTIDLFITGHVDWDIADRGPDGRLEATDIITLPQGSRHNENGD